LINLPLKINEGDLSRNINLLLQAGKLRNLGMERDEIDEALQLLNTARCNAQHPNEAINQPGFPPRVYFNELNADSLNLLVVYWFHPPDHWQSLEFAHPVSLEDGLILR
jgi:small-conductance mechanosensitive channel